MQALCQGRVDLKRNSSCRNIYLYNVLCISQLVQVHIVCLFLPLLGKIIFLKKRFLFSCHVPSSSDAESSPSSVSSASVGKKDWDFNKEKPVAN